MEPHGILLAVGMEPHGILVVTHGVAVAVLAALSWLTSRPW